MSPRARSISNLSGWGRYPRLKCNLYEPRSEPDLRAATADGPAIARGMGRAYGDSALNARATIGMTRFNRMLDFNPATGQLTVEAGVVLGDIIDVFLPRGWFPPVTPGTKFVSVGGMVAADVHGKNHHRHGSFGSFVDWLDLLCPDGAIRRCSRTENDDLFAWTIGGMGLTGIVLRAAFRLTRVESGWIRRKTVAAHGLAETMAAFDAADQWTYSVAWIDCLAGGDRLGRSLLYLGEHARAEELDRAKQARPFTVPGKRRLRMPVNAPRWILHRRAVAAFNRSYFAKGVRQTGETLVDWDSFFYPLDAIRDWNRLYGRHGFAQFQCVLPTEFSRPGLEELLATVQSAGKGSFLAVLKRFGAQDSRFSFPMEGFTLALDVPADRDSLDVIDRLYAIATSHGGRFYLAKDSRIDEAVWTASDKRTAAFRTARRASGADARFSSAQSERLKL